MPAYHKNKDESITTKERVKLYMTCKKCGKQLSPYAYMCGCGEKVTAEEWGVIQIETTGLDVMKDEILRIVILDRHGTAVLNRLYRPRTVTTWEEAQKINHINPRNVAECPVLTEKEVKMISDRYLSRFTTLVTNTSKFTRSFLIAAGFEFPRLVGISGLFESYLEENQKVYFSSGLNACAEYFGYSKYGIRDDFNRMEKAQKIWFCYQNLKLLRLDTLFSEMQGKFETGGVTYETFLSEAQMLDYLKTLHVCSLMDMELPILYYDGMFMPAPTNEVYLLGVSFKDDEEKREVSRVVLCVKNRIVALKETAFVEMQARYRESLEEKEPTLFDMFV